MAEIDEVRIAGGRVVLLQRGLRYTISSGGRSAYSYRYLGPDEDGRLRFHTGISNETTRAAHTIKSIKLAPLSRAEKRRRRG